MNRRSFLIAGAPAALPAFAPSDTVLVAFVGTGTRGSLLLRNMLQVPGVRVVAVCDILPERAAAAAETVRAAGGSARQWADFRKMLDEQKEIQAVVVATPDWTHKNVDIAVLEVGKHLYAEKPLAVTPADCKAIVTAARQAKGIFQAGFQLRHDPARSAAQRFIRQGGIGKVLQCHGIRHTGDLPRKTPWYFDKDKCGDILVDQGIHILDQFTQAIGTHPLRAMGVGGTHLFRDVPPGRSVMDNASVILEYPGGVHVNFSHQFFDPQRFTGIQERVFGAQGAIDLITATWQPADRRGEIKLEVEHADKDFNYMSVAAFIENVRKNNRNPLNNAESAMVSTLVPIMATRAIYERRMVAWEEVAG